MSYDRQGKGDEESCGGGNHTLVANDRIIARQPTSPTSICWRNHELSVQKWAMNEKGRETRTPGRSSVLCANSIRKITLVSEYLL